MYGTFDAMKQMLQNATHVVNSMEHMPADGARYGPSTIYYPATGSALPCVATISGWTNRGASLNTWGEFMASFGFATIVVDPWDCYCDSPVQRAEALLLGLKALHAEHQKTGSALNGRLDISCNAVIGYSLGGTASQIAGMMDPCLKAVVALSPYRLDPNAYKFLTVPTLLISGTDDKKVPAEEHSRAAFKQMPTELPKMYLEVPGDHAVTHGPDGSDEYYLGGFPNFSTVCGLLFGGFGCNDDTGPLWKLCNRSDGYCRPLRNNFAIDQAAKRKYCDHSAIGGVVLAWLQMFMKGNLHIRNIFTAPGITNFATCFKHEGVPLDGAPMQETMTCKIA